jgi:hypothetical protein
MKQTIEVNCDEDGDTYVCWGTADKRKALKEIRSFAENECGLNDELLPKIEDLYLNPLWKGVSAEDDSEEWFYWGDPPKGSKYLGSCYRYDIIEHKL